MKLNCIKIGFLNILMLSSLNALGWGAISNEEQKIILEEAKNTQKIKEQYKRIYKDDIDGDFKVILFTNNCEYFNGKKRARFIEDGEDKSRLYSAVSQEIESNVITVLRKVAEKKSYKSKERVLGKLLNSIEIKTNTKFSGVEVKTAKDMCNTRKKIRLLVGLVPFSVYDNYEKKFKKDSIIKFADLTDKEVSEVEKEYDEADRLMSPMEKEARSSLLNK